MTLFVSSLEYHEIKIRKGAVNARENQNLSGKYGA